MIAQQDAGLYQDRDVSKLGFKWPGAGNLSGLDGRFLLNKHVMGV
jgi:hypothetical protein